MLCKILPIFKTKFFWLRLSSPTPETTTSRFALFGSIFSNFLIEKSFSFEYTNKIKKRTNEWWIQEIQLQIATVFERGLHLTTTDTTNRMPQHRSLHGKLEFRRNEHKQRCMLRKHRTATRRRHLLLFFFFYSIARVIFSHPWKRDKCGSHSLVPNNLCIQHLVGADFMSHSTPLQIFHSISMRMTTQLLLFSSFRHNNVSHRYRIHRKIGRRTTRVHTHTRVHIDSNRA